MQQWSVDTNDFLAIYWVAFKIFNNLAEIINFIEEHIEIKWIRRFDLALDLKIELLKIYKNFKPLKQKWSKFFDNKWELQTFYIWEKKKTLNRYKLLRCYNKKDDILRTKRQNLYIDYLKENNVTRIEFEFRSELCKKITLNQLLDKSYIFSLFLSYIKQYTNIFNSFKFDITKLNVQDKRIDIEELKSNELLKERHLNIFIWYSKTIKEIWWCPVDILLRKDILKETTKKDIVLSIKNWKFRQDIYEFWLNIRNSKYIFSKEIDDVIYLPNEDENE